MKDSLLVIAPEVEASIAEGRNIVALESTIITHGMPYPTNVETALRVEQTIRTGGSTPATIAVIDGLLRVGISERELERLGQAGAQSMKISRRDLPFAVASSTIGGTTVAATMIVAQMAGIEVFATGGIGGVHRGAHKSFDISADLQELAETNVNVVCAGFKSILDLGLTLEYLETHGVAVVGLGTDRLPAFYCRESQFEVPHRVDTIGELVGIIEARNRLRLRGGMVIANPIPLEHSIDAETMEAAIAAAVREASESGITGKDVTPFLLSRVAELSGGHTIDANIELVVHNAHVGAQIARALPGTPKA